MQFNDLLKSRGIEPNNVLVLRHTPEKELRRIFPLLAVERPDLFNAYQSTHGPKCEAAFKKAKYVASFIGQNSKDAIFVGLYKVGTSQRLTHEQFWAKPVFRELKKLGMTGFLGGRSQILWFNLKHQNFYTEWKGKLVVNWPGQPNPYYRWAHRNEFVVLAIAQESLFAGTMPEWRKLILQWHQLQILPPSWRAALKEWRGIYFVFDAKRLKGYVGSAYGAENILGRWRNWSKAGHGGNKHLRDSQPTNLIFSILEIDSHDQSPDEILKKETSWKERLHTYWPNGLNGN